MRVSAKGIPNPPGTTPHRAAGNTKSSAPIPPPTFNLRSSSTFGDYSPGAYFRNILGDQKRIWTSPGRTRTADAFWLAPLIAVGGSLLATDTTVSRGLTNSPSVLNQSSNVSWAAVGALIGAAGGLYLLGKIKHDRHQQETGFLSMESLANALIVNNAVNFAAGRERPKVDNSQGKFWQNGRSFPSNHAVAAWSLASVMAHEYPGILSQLVTYGLAATTSVERVRAKQHFPADVFVGSALGYLVGQQVYRDHHDPSVGGGTTWNTFSELAPDESHNPANFGSPYVPVGSWIYPAFERLAGLGYIRSEMLGMRPWTRLECARLLLEAQDRLDRANANPPEVAVRTYEALKREFQADISRLGGGSNNTAELESLYTRVTGISGKPLTDGYHFGQTLTNDYGRPYQEGTNAIAGFTGWAAAGPIVGYVDAEYQHAPSAPPLPFQARQAIAKVDELPSMPAFPTASVNRMDLLQGYVGFTFHNFEITAGKQSLWWSPAQGGSMMFSNNSEPIDMVQINRVSPLKLPSILGLMGPVRGEFFLGQLSGQQFTFGEESGLLGQWGRSLSDQPMLDGWKIAFNPTPNLQYGFDFTSIFAGAGVPFTWSTFGRSLFSLGNGNPGCYYIGPRCSQIDPGDRRTGFDMTYRLPFLRNWVTFYTDSFSDDEFSPVAYFDRSANSAGLYFNRLPGLPQIDLRVEGVYTDNPLGGDLCCGFYYFNDRYRSGYTNDAHLIGSWVGRDGQGIQAWLTYWNSPKSYIQFGYRHQKVSHQFIPYGGTINDGSVKGDWWLRKDLEVSGLLQYERWDFPVLSPGQQTDFTTSVQLTFWPRWGVQ